MEDFKDLRVWQKAYELTLDVYRKSGAFPKEEMYGLTSQIRRATMSIGANIAEGCGRRSDARDCDASCKSLVARQTKWSVIFC